MKLPKPVYIKVYIYLEKNIELANSNIILTYHDEIEKTKNMFFYFEKTKINYIVTKDPILKDNKYITIYYKLKNNNDNYKTINKILNILSTIMKKENL